MNHNPLHIIAESLAKNGVQGICTVNGFEVIGTLNGEVVNVTLGPAAYCKVKVGEFICTNMAQPFNVGEAARLRRHIDYFENVTSETRR